MTKQSREDIAAVAVIMAAIAMMGLVTLYIARDIKLSRYHTRLMREAVKRQDFERWESE